MPGGWSFLNNSNMSSSTRKVSPMLLLVHFQEGMPYSLLLKLNSLGLSTLKNCMTMIQILLLNILHVYILLKMGSFGIMTICSKKNEYVCLKGP